MSNWADVDAFCAFKPKPGQFSKEKTANSYGFISTPELTLEKPEGTIRIVFLGGSSTVGLPTLKDSDTWPWQTIEMIRDKISKPVEFINAGVGGYSSFESYCRLWSRIRHFSPDIVMVYHGWNEMYYFNKADDILSWRTQKDGSWSISKTHKPVAIFAPHWVDPFIKWSQFLSRIRVIFAHANEGELGVTSDTPLKKDFNHKGIPIWRTNLKLLRETSSVLGAKLFVAKQATLIVPGLSSEDRERCLYYFHGFDHDAHVRAFSEIYKVINEEISKDSVIDLTPLSGRSEVFVDHIHLTPAGCRKIASVVSKTLISYINQMETP